MKLRLMALALVLLVVAADQITKWQILTLFGLDSAGRHIQLTGFFDLVLWWNRGVSFGLLVHDLDAMPYILTALALAIAAGLCLWLWRTADAMKAAALALVIGGAVGNAVDRLRFGAVVDFLYFHIGDHYWPAFNLADSAICVGVVLLLLLEYRTGPRKDIGSGAESA